MTLQKLVQKIDYEYLKQFPKDRQGPAALGIGAYQVGDLGFDEFNELLSKIEELAKKAGYKIDNGYFKIVAKYADQLAELMQKEMD